ncbi:1-phosphatidylinositol phosphodiesterase [Golovinomyces cichoracearum]|uniref:1-phosphatidylinositol phosphodiesterase n=1 Tax=Golovinomyces cichoracearum TaxID=62708 RepID=A0A420HGH7_9PEZI|nr:1-phosphatidylinositol phosphodiesterase [Golovinomyces cichoracearum]
MSIAFSKTWLKFLLLWLCSTVLLCYCQAHNNWESIEKFALNKVLQDAAPIFGDYKPKNSNNSRWMAKYPDETMLVHMNLPGTHDSQTWNYSSDTQKSLKRVTRLGGMIVAPAKFYRCQEISLLSMLEQGIRVLDLRIALDVTGSSLVFWHAQALQSQTATLESVLFAFYKWLDDHPSETIMISLKYEGLTTIFGRNKLPFQKALYEALTSPTARRYFLPIENDLGTIGSARGKIILLRRFELDMLPPHERDSIPGVLFPPSEWKKNGHNFTIIYNRTKNHMAHIQDHFHLSGKRRFSVKIQEAITLKFDIIKRHLEKAMISHNDDLIWSFTSAEKNLNIPPLYPKVIAFGDEKNIGVNYMLTKFFQDLKGTNSRLGIVMFDFSDTPGEMVKSFLEIQSP